MNFSYKVQKETVIEICDEISAISKQLQTYTDDMIKYLSQLTTSRGYTRLSKNVIENYKLIGDEYSDLIMNEANKFFSILNLTLEFDNGMIQFTPEEAQSFWKKTFSTAAMTLVNLVEGIGIGTENIIDGGLVLTTYITDFFNLDGATSWLEDRIENQAVNTFFDNLFEENQVFQAINENSIYKYDDTASTILQNVGTAITYIGAAAIVGAPAASTVYLGTLGSETSDNLQAGMNLQEARSAAQKPALTAAAITLAAGPLGGLVNTTVGTGLTHLAITGATIINDATPPQEIVTVSPDENSTTDIPDTETTPEEIPNGTDGTDDTPTPQEPTPDSSDESTAGEEPWIDDTYDTGINNDEFDTIFETDNDYQYPEYDFEEYEPPKYPEYNDNENMDFDDNTYDNDYDYNNNTDNNNHYPWNDDSWYNSSSATDFVGDITNKVEENIISHELANKVSDMEEIIDLTQGVNIPTSSTPIKSSINTKDNNMAPLMAGLAAASLAGLGTKSYLDKRTKEDEEDELNDVEIDTFDNESYKLDTEEKDYLTPTDEFAYRQEEKYETTNMNASPKFN